MKWKIPIILVLFGILILYLSLSGRAKVKVDIREEFLRHYIKSQNPYLSDGDVAKIASSLVNWCGRRGVNLWSFTAIVQRESSFRPFATGDSVSRGLCQLTRIALDELVNKGYITSYDWNRLFDIDYNVQLGTLYYLYCARLAKGNRREAIARYRKTSAPLSPTAQAYADSVLKIREKIVEEFEKFESAT